MRWLSIRKARIDADLRDTFERYGVVGMQVVMGTHNTFKHRGVWHAAADEPTSIPLLSWLTEKADGAERWETWSLTMEIAITVFVGIELFYTIFLHR